MTTPEEEAKVIEAPIKKAVKVKKETIAIAEVVVIEPDKKENDTARALANIYIDKGQIVDFSQVPEYAKLCVVQKTPGKFIKHREIWVKGRKVALPYVSHLYTEKVLNMVFNFQVSNEIKHHEFREYDEEYMDYSQKDSNGNATPKKAIRKVIEAEVLIEFVFGTGDKQIKRSVYSSHKGYSNPATTRGDIMKSAISKAWTAVARTFGVGSDIQDKEEKGYKQAEKAQAQAKTYKATTTKDLGY